MESDLKVAEFAEEFLARFFELVEAAFFVCDSPARACLGGHVLIVVAGLSITTRRFVHFLVLEEPRGRFVVVA